jgi:4-amino-4-deoxy-L-arabinose transferase-like glycosyltransferase
MIRVVHRVMNTNSSRIGLVALVVCAFALRLGYCQAARTLGQTPQAGYREYVIAGERLLARGEFVSPLIGDDAKAGKSSLFPPGYIAYVAAVYALFGIESGAATLVLQVTNAAATALAVGLVFLIAARAGGRRAGWAAGVIAALNPTLIGYTSYVWETSLFTLGVVVSVWLSQRLARTPIGARRYFAYGVWLGALALLNPALTIAYPLLVLYPLCRTYSGRWKRISMGVLAAVLGWSAAIAPWTIRNYVEFGELIYVRSGFMLELWLGVCPEADAHGAAVFQRQYPLSSIEVQGKVAEMGEEAFIAECSRKAKEAIAADPVRFAKLVLMRVVDYWTGASLTHAEPDGSVIPRSPGRLAVMIFLTVEVLVLLIALFMRSRRADGLMWILTILLLFSIVYCVTHVQVRYRTPSEPLVAVLLGTLLFGRTTRAEVLDRMES